VSKQLDPFSEQENRTSPAPLLYAPDQETAVAKKESTLTACEGVQEELYPNVLPVEAGVGTFQERASKAKSINVRVQLHLPDAKPVNYNF
jgi:acyl-CoA hydrolase